MDLLLRFGDEKLPERFWRKVKISETGCWLWQASKNADGYGNFKYGKNSQGSHRIAYEVLVQKIPNKLQLDHLCRTRHCVNPAHLEPVTQKENILRSESPSAKNAKKLFCARGHLLSAENLLICYSGRICKLCKLQYNYAKRDRLRSAGLCWCGHPLFTTWLCRACADKAARKAKNKRKKDKEKSK